MEGYTVQQLLTAIGVDPGRYELQLREMQVTGLSTDSRSTRPGEVFFALKGDRFDGASFVGEAAKAGAVLAVANKSAELKETAEIPTAVVDDTIAALGNVAADYRSMFTGTVIAVTGTNGKTTVKEMLLAVLGEGFRQLAHDDQARGRWVKPVPVRPDLVLERAQGLRRGFDRFPLRFEPAERSVLHEERQSRGQDHGGHRSDQRRRAAFEDLPGEPAGAASAGGGS